MRFVIQDPLLVVAATVLVLVVACAIALMAWDRYQIARGLAATKLPPPLDHWDEYRLVADDGVAVSDGARLPVGTTLRIERIGGPEPTLRGPRFALTGSGDFRAGAAVHVEGAPNSTVLCNEWNWSCSAMPLGTTLRFDRPGQFNTTVYVIDRQQDGPQRILRFEVVDEESTERSTRPPLDSHSRSGPTRAPHAQGDNPTPGA